MREWGQYDIFNTVVIMNGLRAQNNGRSTDNVQPKMPLDGSLFYLTDHFDRGHIFMPSNVIAVVLN